MINHHYNYKENAIGLSSLTAGTFLYEIFYLFAIVFLFRRVSGMSAEIFTIAERIFLFFTQLFTLIVPYAMARMVRKYAKAENLRSIVLIRKVFLTFFLLVGIILGVIGLLISPIFVSFLTESSYQHHQIAVISLYFMVLAVGLMSVLAGYRGFYLFLKSERFTLRLHLLEHSLQFIFFTFALLILKNTIGYDPYIVLSYFMSAVPGTALTLFLYVKYDRSHIGPLIRQARSSEYISVSKRRLFFEMLQIVLPVSLLLFGYHFVSIIDMVLLPYKLKSLNVEMAKASYLYEMIHIGKNYFLVPIVGFIFILLYKNNIFDDLSFFDSKEFMKSKVGMAVVLISLVSIPLLVFQISLSKPIAYLLFGAQNIEYTESILSWGSAEAFVRSLSLFSIYCCIKANLKPILFFSSLVSIAFKVLGTLTLIPYLGFIGSVISTTLSYGAFSYLSLAWLVSRKHYDLGDELKSIIKIIIAAISANGVIAILKIVNFPLNLNENLMIIGFTVGYLVFGIFTYFAISQVFKLPQQIFGVSWIRIFFRRESENHYDN